MYRRQVGRGWKEERIRQSIKKKLRDHKSDIMERECEGMDVKQAEMTKK